MSFKILAIGDVHGREVLSRIPHADFDKIVFIGDYVDTHYEADFSNEMFIQNLQKILQYKKDHPDKVILLLGNHDIHYMYHEEVGSFSGYRADMLAELRPLFLENSPHLSMAYGYRNTLFTHAGISNRWYEANCEAIHQELRNIKDKTGIEVPLTLSEKMNVLRSSVAGRKILFAVSGLRMFPRNAKKAGGIVWADKRETENDYLRNFHQVVGHTVVDTIQIGKDPADENSSITYIDTENREFLELEVQ
jgi:predicted MPP superfamily phosphohydrolase